MNDPAREHWTEDEELLRAYILGRIPDEERARLRGHLSVCTRCREVENRERLLAAGVRRLGREQLRASLRRNLGTTQAARIPWLRIAAAAAVVVIAGGVLLFTRWSSLQREHTPAPLHDRGKEETGSVVTENLPRSGAEAKEPPHVPAPGDKTPHVEEQMKKGEAGTAAARPSAPTAGTEEHHHEDWWRGRHVLPGGPNDSLMSDARPALAAEADTRGKAEFRRTQHAEGFVLHQQLLEILPPARKGEAGDGIPIRVERKHGRTHLTLYVPTLFDEVLMRSATVEKPAKDSLLITVGAATIGIHIPPSPRNR